MLLVPYRVEGEGVSRTPWVTAAVALLCVLVHSVGPMAVEQPAKEERLNLLLKDAFTRWAQDPIADPAPRFKKLFVTAQAEREIKALRAQLPQPVMLHPWMDGTLAEAMEIMDSTPGRSWALVPERGLLQRGLVTHMFFHANWPHLVFNLLFFLVLARFLEDLWGRAFFAGFYLVGGMVAGWCHFLLDKSSPVMMVGASGAIAACMGAFLVRFGQRRMRFFWLLDPVLLKGRFWLPGYVFLIYWFLGEVFQAGGARHGGGGTALMAHVGGFIFGSLAAGLMLMTGAEDAVRRWVGRSAGGHRHPEMEAAHAALGKGNVVKARGLLKQVIAHEPHNWPAVLDLAVLEWKHGYPPEAVNHTQDYFLSPNTHTARAQRLLAWRRLLPVVKQELVPAVVLLAAAQALGRTPGEDVAEAEGLLAAALAKDATLAPQAHLLMAQMAMERRFNPDLAQQHLAALAPTAGDASMAAEIAALTALIQSHRGVEAPPAPTTAPYVVPARLELRRGPGETPPGMVMTPAGPAWKGFPPAHGKLGTHLGGRKGKTSSAAWKKGLQLWGAAALAWGVGTYLLLKPQPEDQREPGVWMVLGVVAFYWGAWVLAQRHAAIAVYAHGVILGRDVALSYAGVEHLTASTTEQWLPSWALRLFQGVPFVASHMVLRLDAPSQSAHTESFLPSGRASLDHVFNAIKTPLLARLMRRLQVGSTFQVGPLRFTRQGLWAVGRRLDYSSLAPVGFDDGVYVLTLRGEEYPLLTIPVDVQDACLLPDLLAACAVLPAAGPQAAGPAGAVS